MKMNNKDPLYYTYEDWKNYEKMNMLFTNFCNMCERNFLSKIENEKECKVCHFLCYCKYGKIGDQCSKCINKSKIKKK